MKKFVLALLLAAGSLGAGPAAPASSAPAAAAESSQPTALADVSIPVLCYHVVSDNPSGRYQLSLTKFREQMSYLAAHGYTALTADEYQAVMTGQVAAPPKPILLTFDDGTADFATNVVPVLDQHGFPATQFAVSEWVGTPGKLTAAQLTALHQQGHDVQNHTATHEDLSSLSHAAALQEVSTADRFITGTTGEKPELFAYPYGRYDADAQQALRDVGITMAFTVSGGKTSPTDDFLALNRNMIVSSETMSSFVKKVS